MTKLFGTDGIRGEAYAPPLDRPTVVRVGQALAAELSNVSKGVPRVLIGRDTRASGPDIEAWLTAGISAAGGTTTSAGIIPTPAVAFLTTQEGFDAGVVISASHNPYQDNGIKIFSGDGVKLSDAFEEAIERTVAAGAPVPEAPANASTPSLHLEARYQDHLRRSLGQDVSFDRLKIALDCANGAGYRVGPSLLRELGLDVLVLSDQPDGENINRACGSTAMNPLRDAVTANGCALGAALDGDGDRVLLVDSSGRVVDGDAVLLVCARRLQKEGRLAEDGVVATVMSNMALEVALAGSGIALHRTRVGDKFVAQEMTSRNIMVGGEQSGHIIFSDYASTGDGLLTLVQVLRVLALERKGLDELAHLEPFPQVLVNVRVRSRPKVEDVPEIARAIQSAESELTGRGRVLIRYSGTEPLLRIMMEGPDQSVIEALAEDVRAVVQESIGA